VGEKNAKPRPPKTWGMSADEFFYALKEKPVQVGTTDGKVYAGTLIGVDTYDIIIRLSNGHPALIPKHAIKYCAPDGRGG